MAATHAGHHLIVHSASWLDVRDKPEMAWPTMRMAGQEVFRWVIRDVPDTARSAVDRAGLTTAELAAFVPHQANLRIVDGLADRLRLPEHVVIARDVITAGNTSGASIPLAADQLLASGAVRSGGLALLAGFGAGLTQAAMVVSLP